MNAASNETVEFFLHRAGAKPVVVEASPNEMVNGILGRGGCATDASVPVVLEPHREHQLPPEEEQAGDADEAPGEPVDCSRTPAELGHHGPTHIFCGCRQITVKIQYEHQTLTRRVAPHRTADWLRLWALRRLGLTGADAARLFLGVCGKQKVLDAGDRLIEHVESPGCELCLILGPRELIEG